MKVTKVIKQMTSITHFNKGKASKLFSKVKKGDPLIVVKNNIPVAIIISPDEYDIIEEYYMSKEANPK